MGYTLCNSFCESISVAVAFQAGDSYADWEIFVKAYSKFLKKLGLEHQIAKMRIVYFLSKKPSKNEMRKCHGYNV